MKQTISREFIFRYLEGKSTSIQKQLIENWLKDPENEELFYRYIEEWERTNPQYFTNIQSAIGKFNSRISRDTAPIAPCVINRPGASRTRWMQGIAAGVSVLLIASWFFRENLLYRTLSTQPGEIAGHVLPDGSNVTLNSNSTLLVPRLWEWSQEREVKLTGEAEFKITKTADARKFTVKTKNGIDITVLGTTFNVFNRRHRTEVVLSEGKVMVTQLVGNSSKNINMNPGDRIVFNQTTGIITRNTINPEKTALWKEKRFEFDQTPLADIPALLKDQYDLDVSFPVTLLDSVQLSGSFRALSPEDYLDHLSLLTGLSYSRNGSRIIFEEEKNQ